MYVIALQISACDVDVIEVDPETRDMLKELVSCYYKLWFTLYCAIIDACNTIF